MSLFNFESIAALYEKSLGQATRRLTGIPVFCGTPPKVNGVNGWVFEQTVRYCLTREMKAKGIRTPFEEQVSLGGRACADLRVGPVLIETKARGIWGAGAAERYRGYRGAARQMGFRYLFITMQETVEANRRACERAVGRRNYFILERKRDWQRFVTEVLREQQIGASPAQ